MNEPKLSTLLNELEKAEDILSRYTQAMAHARGIQNSNTIEEADVKAFKQIVGKITLAAWAADNAVQQLREIRNRHPDYAQTVIEGTDQPPQPEPTSENDSDQGD